MAAFFVGKTGAVAEYVMIYEYRYFVYLDNSQKYLDFLAEKALYPCRFRLVGKGLERETLCPFPRLRRFGTHIETGSKFLLLFSIKSKEERSCFAEIVINGRIPYFRRALFWRTCAQSVWSTAFSVAGHKKRYKIFSCISLFDCGDRIWTCDLRVMSPTSYRTALLRGSIKWAEKDSNLRSYRNRFTVCPLWPLGNPPMVMESFFDYELPTHDALGIVQGSEWKMMEWFSSVKKKNLP